MKNIITISFVVLLAATSCKFQDPAFIDVVEMGAAEKSQIVPRYGGDCTFDVYSTVPYDATIISGNNWLSFAQSEASQTHHEGSGVLHFHYRDNNEGKRVAYVVLSAEYRRDTIAIKQNGPYTEFLEVETSAVKAPVTGLEYSLPIETNLLNDAISVYTDNASMVTNLRIYSNVLHFTVTNNTTRNPRSAFVYVSYVDGWDEEQRAVISVTQAWE